MLFKTKALIVDDEEVVRNFCKTVLLHEGLAVETAPNGQVALEALANDNFDLILLDIKMPDMDGLSLLKKIKFFEI